MNETTCWMDGYQIESIFCSQTKAIGWQNWLTDKPNDIQIKTVQSFGWMVVVLVFTNNIQNIYALYSDLECCWENILSQNKNNLSPLFRPTTRAREVGPNENTNDDHIKGHDYLVSMEMKG